MTRKEKPSSAERGDEQWKDNMNLWEGSKPIVGALGKLNAVGSDLWYKTPPPYSGQTYKGYW